MPQKLEEIRFPKNPEVGKYYMVPCIRVTAALWDGDEYCPVNTHLHEDSKIIKFKYKHWHIDWRFVSRPMHKRKVVETDFNRKDGMIKSEAAQIIVLDEIDFNLNSTTDHNIYYKRLKCKRQYLAGGFHGTPYYQNITNTNKENWIDCLAETFSGSKLKEINGQLICPHKGAVIDRNCKDADGNFVCPAHLLRFNPETLEAIKPKSNEPSVV